MKLSNFQVIKTVDVPYSGTEIFATVDVETGALWWKKKTEMNIRKKPFGHWHFIHNGEYTPQFQAENLYRSWEAKRMLQK